MYPLTYASFQFKLRILDAHLQLVHDNRPFVMVMLKQFVLNLFSRRTSSRMEISIASLLALNPAVLAHPVISIAGSTSGAPALVLVSDDAAVAGKVLDAAERAPSCMTITLQPLLIHYDEAVFQGLGSFFSGPAIADCDLLRTDPPTVLPPPSTLTLDVGAFRFVLQAPSVLDSSAVPGSPSRTPARSKSILSDNPHSSPRKCF